MKVEPTWWDLFLYMKRHQVSSTLFLSPSFLLPPTAFLSFLFSFCHVRMQWGGGCLQVARRTLAGTLTMLPPRFWICRPPKQCETNFCYLVNPVCGILVRQSKLTKISDISFKKNVFSIIIMQSAFISCYPSFSMSFLITHLSFYIKFWDMVPWYFFVPLFWMEPLFIGHHVFFSGIISLYWG